MALELPSDANEAAHAARRMALALDAIETELSRLHLGAEPNAIADALALPLRAFDAAARRT
jgi:hypothetical protein